MTDRFLIEVIHDGYDAILEFLFGRDADVGIVRQYETSRQTILRAKGA